MENIMTWYNQQMKDAEFNRLGVLAFILLIHTCIIIPATILIISEIGYSALAIGTSAIFSFAILFSMIACLPVKITLPLFVVSTLAHIGLILMSMF